MGSDFSCMSRGLKFVKRNIAKDFGRIVESVIGSKPKPLFFMILRYW